MAENLKTRLARQSLRIARGAKHPPYCDLSIADAFARFCQELAGKEFRDPRGHSVIIRERNFPKLLGMKKANPITRQPIADPGSRKAMKAKASHVIRQLKGGEFQDAAHYVESGRHRTLFWIPDVITDPDGIHLNAHPIVAGDEVYVKRYDKMGAEVKIVVVEGTQGTQSIIITSLLTTESKLPSYVAMPPIWSKK